MFHRSSKRYFTLSLATFIPPCAHCEKGDSTNIEVNDFALHSSIKHKQKDLKVNEIFSSQHIVGISIIYSVLHLQIIYQCRCAK